MARVFGVIGAFATRVSSGSRRRRVKIKPNVLVAIPTQATKAIGQHRVRSNPEATGPRFITPQTFRCCTVQRARRLRLHIRPDRRVYHGGARPQPSMVPRLFSPNFPPGLLQPPTKAGQWICSKNSSRTTSRGGNSSGSISPARWYPACWNSPSHWRSRTSGDGSTLV